MQITTVEIMTLQTLFVHVVWNSAIFPQILYDIVLYAQHFLPAKYYFNKQYFELPQNVTWILSFCFYLFSKQCLVENIQE